MTLARGVESIKHRSLNMFTLIALGVESPNDPTINQ